MQPFIRVSTTNLNIPIFDINMVHIMKEYMWLAVLHIYSQGILDKFDFLIDGRAKKQIEVFIKKKPKFEEICKELEVKTAQLL